MVVVCLYALRRSCPMVLCPGNMGMLMNLRRGRKIILGVLYFWRPCEINSMHYCIIVLYCFFKGAEVLWQRHWNYFGGPPLPEYLKSNYIFQIVPCGKAINKTNMKNQKNVTNNQSKRISKQVKTQRRILSAFLRAIRPRVCLPTSEDASGVSLSVGLGAWVGAQCWLEEDWLRPKNPPKQSKIAKRLLQTHLINISSPSPRVVLPHEHLLWRLRQQERKKMPTESSCLLDSVPEWGCSGLNRIDWRSKPLKQPKIIKNCQKTKRLLQIHLINISYIWSSLSPRVVSPHEHLLWRPRQQERLGVWLGRCGLKRIDWDLKTPKAVKNWQRTFPNTSHQHIIYHIYLSIPLPRRRFASASAFTAAPTATEDAMESSCSLVFWIRCLIGDVMLAQRGPQSSQKKTKRLTQNMPTIARVSVCIVCAPFLPALLSANVLTNCLQPLRRGLSPATPEICGGEAYQKGSKIITNIQKSLAGGKMEKYSLHVQSSEPASQSLTVFDRQMECTKPSSGWHSSRAEESCKIQNSRKSRKHINGTL